MLAFAVARSGNRDGGPATDVAEEVRTPAAMRSPVAGRLVTQATKAPVLQAKLTVGSVDDAAEHEAEHVAREVVAALAGASVTGNGNAVPGHRDEAVRRQPTSDPSGPQGGPVSEEMEASLRGARGTGRALPDATRTTLEPVLGMNLGGVRVHTGSIARSLSESIGAEAFTVGSDVFFRRGLPDVATPSGQHLLAHELTHVAQQGPGAHRLFNPFKKKPAVAAPQAAPSSVAAPQAGQQAAPGSALLAMAQAANASERKAMAADPKLRADLDRADPVIASQARALLGLPPATAPYANAVQAAAWTAGAPRPPAGQGRAVATTRRPTKPASAPILTAAPTVSAPGALIETPAVAGVLVGEGRIGAPGALLETPAVGGVLVGEGRVGLPGALLETPAVVGAAELTPEERATAQAEIDAALASGDELMQMSLAQLGTYLAANPGWAQRSDLSAEISQLVMNLANFLTLKDTAVACAAFTVGGLHEEAEDEPLDEFLDGLADYSRAVGPSAKPFALTPKGDLEEAAIAANGLGFLLFLFPGWVLATAMTEEVFLRLEGDQDLAEATAEYVLESSTPPTFQTPRDFSSLFDMVEKDGADPAEYAEGPLSDYVRNVHRFEGKLLDQMLLNLEPIKDASKRKPLTLVLHSALDNNGAFNRDPNLTAVFTNSHNNAILVEGGKNLDDYRAAIAPIAEKFGRHGKVDQVMFAGHGSSRSVQMAGTIVPRKNGKSSKEKHEKINLDEDRAAADELFDEVLRHMALDEFLGSDQTSSRRALFNACAANTDMLPFALFEDGQAAQAEIVKYLEKNPNIVSYFSKRAQEGGRSVKTIGAKASLGQVSLVKPNGQLTISSASDPALSSSSLDYAERGADAVGVLQATLVLAAHGDDLTQLFAARGAMGVHTLDDVMIKGAFEYLSKNIGRPLLPDLRSMVGIAESLEDLCDDSIEEALSHYDPADSTKWRWMLSHMSESPEWSRREFRLLIGQLSLFMSPTETREHNFVTRVAQFATVAELQTGPGRWIAWKQLSPAISGILKPGATRDPGKDLLALAAIAGKIRNVGAESYLRAAIGDKEMASATTLPTILANRLGGAASEEEILTAIR